MCASSADAVVFTVTTTNDSGPGSLRDAVAQANASTSGPKAVQFAVTGRIVLTTGPIAITGPLTIDGPGSGKLTIDGNANDRIFVIADGNAACPALTAPNDYNVDIWGLTLVNARHNADEPGGAILTTHSLTVFDVVFRNNHAKAGGGIAFMVQSYPSQSAFINESRFVDNVARPLSPVTSDQDGAALLIAERCPGATIDTSIAVSVSIGTTTFAGNRAQPATRGAHGAAIYSAANVAMVVQDSRIVGNSIDVPNPPAPGATYQGAAFRGYAQFLAINRVEISDNAVSDAAGSDQSRGGALYVVSDDPARQAAADATALSIYSSTVSGNRVDGDGGAIAVFGNVKAEFRNATIADNAAPSNRTGGVLLSTGPTNPPSAGNATAPTLKLVSTILARSAASTADVATTASIPTLVVDASQSWIETVCGACGVSISGAGNVLAGDPMLESLAFNGGVTRTQPPLAGSAAIDAGSNPDFLSTDQRGFARVVGAGIDMGAAEAQVALAARLLAPDGTSIRQTFVDSLDTRWFAMPVEPGKTYAVEAIDADDDSTANGVTLDVYDLDGATPPFEASVSCFPPTGPPAVAIAGNGGRCIVRTAPPDGAVLDKRPLYLKVRPFIIAPAGQFRIRARESTIYGRWLTAGYDFHVEIENTTADAACVEVVRYGTIGSSYDLARGWSGPTDRTNLSVPAFGAVKHVVPKGTLVGSDSEGALRIGACDSPANGVPAGLYVSTYAFDASQDRYLHFFTSTSNEGRTRSTW